MTNTEAPAKNPAPSKRGRTLALGALLLLVGSATTALAVGTTPTDHPVTRSHLGSPRPVDELLALVDVPGPLEAETVVAADWEVDRAGLINLDSPQAKGEGLVDGPEPIQIYFHVVTHPSRGAYLIDTGIERALVEDPEHAAIRGVIAKAMHTEKLHVKNPLGRWLDEHDVRPAGVFLTHLHLDHIGGLPDVPRGTPIYVGPGETTWRGWENFFVGGVTERLFEGHGEISEWPYAKEPSAALEAAVDVFGDGSFWAISAPGHTPGSSAYLARTKRGPVLYVGDACHTAWGWRNGVEPGDFSHDKPASRESLAELRAFAAAHPKMEVRLGHQALD